MLKNIEPPYDIRFVEKINGKTEIQNIYSFPAIVGHLGTVKPLIFNGKISKAHCRITHDLIAKTYRIEDGADGKPSTNHIYYGEGGETKAVDSVELSHPGQIVYLIRLTNGEEAYLELYDPRKSYSYECPTQDLDPRYVLTEKKAEEAHAIATKNKEQIAELDGRIKQFLIVGEYMANNPLRVITVALLSAFVFTLLAPAAFLTLYRDNVAEWWFGDKIERKK